MAPFYAIDASVQIFRAWHALDPDYHDHEGHPVHAVFGFVGFLLTLLENERPQFIGVCFDEALTGSFRNQIYPDYKAHRDPPPLELRRQFNYCRAAAELLGLPCYSSEAYEADDLIGALVVRARNSGHPSVIVSSDKDLCQLVAEGDLWWDFTRNRRLDHAGVHARFGVPPEAIADLLALTGDPVDNIPGVPGVGPKSAAALLSHFGGLDDLLERVDEIDYLRLRGAKTIGRSIRAALATIETARQLTMIATDAPLPEPVSLARRRPDLEGLDELFDQLRFGRLLRQRAGQLPDPRQPGRSRS